jgi:ATP-dependent HslUV protease subunit HslV
LHGDNLAPSSVARKLAALRSFFRFLCRRGTLKSNPAELVVGPRLPRRTTAHLNVDDAFQLMASPRYPEDSDPSGISKDAETLSIRDRAILELFYAAGLRIGELTGLNLADLDSAEGLVRVLGKGRKERIVPVGRTAVAALRDYLDVRGSLQQRRDETRAEAAALFLNARGGRLTSRGVSLIVLRHLQSSGLGKKITTHGLRHSFATHLLCVRHAGRVAMAGDGQVSFGDRVMKHTARKVRRMCNETVIAGFAGAAADAFALFAKFEAKLEEFGGNLPRAAVELAKDWRMDRALRRLEALLAVANADDSLIISGTGDVIEPDDGIIGIGSGGGYAAAAARALVKHSTLSAREIVEEGMRIAAGLCVYTNDRVTIEEL